MKPPKHISDPDVKKLWLQLWPKLAALDMVDDNSVDAFDMLCSDIVMFRRANAARLALDDLYYVIPNGAITTRPEVKMCENLEKHMLATLKEFGMTPKSAKDLGIRLDADDDEETAEFNAL